MRTGERLLKIFQTVEHEWVSGEKIGAELHISRAAVQPFSVVEDLYVVEQISPYIIYCSIFTPVKVFLFQERKLFH